MSSPSPASLPPRGGAAEEPSSRGSHLSLLVEALLLRLRLVGRDTSCRLYGVSLFLERPNLPRQPDRGMWLASPTSETVECRITTRGHQMEPTWLNTLIVDAEEHRWCTRPNCTTCGAGDLRSCVFSEAMELAGLEVPEPAETSPRRLIETLQPVQRAAVFEQIVRGLRGVDRSAARAGSALRTILMDLHPPLMKWGVPESLSERLNGTFAGQEFDAMQAHSASLADERARRAEYEGPKAVAERREARRVARERRLQQRLEKKTARDAARDKTLVELAALSGMKRLVKIAGYRPLISLESIPDHLVPLDADCRSLDVEAREGLIALIARRRGAWGRLRRQLIALRPESDASSHASFDRSR